MIQRTPPHGAAPLRARVTKAGLSVLISAALVLTGCGSGGSAGTGGGDMSTGQQQLYQQAVDAGGELTVFVGSSGNEQLDALRSAFNDQFPDVALQWISGTGDQVQERFLTEQRAGLHSGDVVILAGIKPFELINAEGYLAQFIPEEADLYSYDNNPHIPGLAYAFADMQSGVCYNPDNLTEEEVGLLRSYQGWADPRWKGRATIVNAEAYGYRHGLTYWAYDDPQLGDAWLQRLAQVDPTVYSSANAAAPQVIAGEDDVIFNALTFVAARQARLGAPLRCITSEYAPATVISVGLAKSAPNTAAGALFSNWLLSEAGQTAVQDTFAYNARRQGFDRPVIDEDWWETPKDVRFVNEDQVEQRYHALDQRFNDLFGGAPH